MFFTTLLLTFAATQEPVSPDTAARDTVSLPEMILTETQKTKVTLLPLTTSIVNAGQIEKSTESSLLPVLVSKVPGLFVTERGMAGYGVSGGAAGMVNIRGVGQGNKVLFMVDGQPQWAGIFGHALPDTYTSNGVERVEVVRGPSSLLYGSNAMGGSVNIITRQAKKEGFSGRARAMLGSYLTQRYGLTGGYRKGPWNASAGVTFDASKGNRNNSHYWLANEYAEADYSASEHWTVGSNLHLTQTKAQNPGSLQSPLESMWTRVFRGTAAMYVKDLYEHARGGVQVYLNWGRNHVDDGWAPGAPPTDYIYNSTDYNTGFTLYQTVNPWRGNDLSAGFDFQQWGGHQWNEAKGDAGRLAEFKRHEKEIAGYLMMQQAFLGDILSLNAGLRMQHGTQYGNELVPQAGFILHPFAGNSFKFSWGKGFRAPNLRELYLYRPANPDLKPEYLWNYEIEWRQSAFDGRLNAGLSLFFIDGRDMIQTVMTEGRPKNMNTGRFINKGLEIDAAWRITPEWQADANYSYLHTDKALLAAPKNKLNVELTYSPGRFSFSLESVSVWCLYTQTGRDAAMQSYSLLNFRGSYTLRTAAPLTLFAKIDNMLAKKYEIVYGFPMPRCTVMAGVEVSF